MSAAGRSWPDHMARWAEFLGLTLLVGALGWWMIVYAQVISNTGFPLARTLPCLLYTSDRCSLAMALCKDWHFLGIKRYSAELLWTGAAISGASILWQGLRGDPRRETGGDLRRG